MYCQYLSSFLTVLMVLPHQLIPSDDLAKERKKYGKFDTLKCKSLTDENRTLQIEL
jgi:hypothetical protein